MLDTPRIRKAGLERGRTYLPERERERERPIESRRRAGQSLSRGPRANTANSLRYNRPALGVAFAPLFRPLACSLPRVRTGEPNYIFPDDRTADRSCIRTRVIGDLPNLPSEHRACFCALLRDVVSVQRSN